MDVAAPLIRRYAAELHDFLTSDVKRWYPDLQHKVIAVVVVVHGVVMVLCCKRWCGCLSGVVLVACC